MQGPIKEGVFRTSEGEFVKIEQRHYPKLRWVILELIHTPDGLKRKDELCPPLSDEQWAKLETWL